MVRAVEWKIFALEHVDPATSETDRARRARELEVDVRKLFGVLSLPWRASAVAERFRPTIRPRTICAKVHFSADSCKINPGKSLTMSGNACAAFVGKIEDLQQVFLLLDLPEHAAEPASGIRHGASALAPVTAADGHCVRLAFSSGRVSGTKSSIPMMRSSSGTRRTDRTGTCCELSQQGIASRAYQPGPFSSRESIPAAWDRYYLQVMKVTWL